MKILGNGSPSTFPPSTPTIKVEQIFQYLNFMFIRLLNSQHPIFTRLFNMGSRKSGKSHQVLDFLTNVFLAIPNSIIYIVRDTEKRLHNTIKDVEKLLIKKGFEIDKLTFNKKQFIIRNFGLTNSSIWKNKIIFHTLNPERIKDEMGGEAGGTTFDGTDNMFVFFEECTQLKKHHIDIFLDTVRGYKTLITLYCANPWSPMNWYVQLFNKQLPPNRAIMEQQGYQIKQVPIWEDYLNNTQVYIGESVYCRTSVAINQYVSLEEKAKLYAYKDIDNATFEISYLGLDGIQEGALYVKSLEKMKSIDYEAIYENSVYNSYKIQVGIDWGIGQDKNAGATTCYLGFVSASNGVNVCYEYTRWNNNKRKPQQKALNEAEMMLEIINKIKEWRQEIIGIRPYADNKIIAYVDNGSMGEFHQKWNSMLVNVGLTMYDIEFRPAPKYDIEERVTVCNLMLCFGTLRIDKEKCPELIKAMSSTFRIIPRTGLKEDTRFERTPETTHWINGGIEYLQGDMFNTFRLPFQQHYEGRFNTYERKH